MSDRLLVRANALGRVAIGAALMLAPRLAGSAWIGRGAADRGTQVFIRAMGARDVALGLGTLVALDRPGPMRPWLLGAFLADLTDAAATAAAAGEVPDALRTRTTALALTAAASDAYLAARLP